MLPPRNPQGAPYRVCPKFRGTLLGTPILRNTIGAILGSPYFGKLPYMGGGTKEAPFKTHMGGTKECGVPGDTYSKVIVRWSLYSGPLIKEPYPRT